ncbi:MAG TPA: hypothetical protein VJN67_09295 [Stellaceae bacterium]|nr:hypothetical protein [Stellaceae bacterium]
MQTYTAQQIIDDINAYMRSVGGLNRDWYAGIASNAETRLFNDHAVSRAGGNWIWRRATSSAVARDVEKAYLDAGCDGGGGGGDYGTDCVYVYRKTSTTSP